MDTENTGPEPAGGDEAPAVEHVEQLASYGVRVNLMRKVGENLEPLTNMEMIAAVTEALKGMGYSASARSERLDK